MADKKAIFFDIDGVLAPIVPGNKAHELLPDFEKKSGWGSWKTIKTSSTVPVSDQLAQEIKNLTKRNDIDPVWVSNLEDLSSYFGEKFGVGQSWEYFAPKKLDSRYKHSKEKFWFIKQWIAEHQNQHKKIVICDDKPFLSQKEIAQELEMKTSDILIVAPNDQNGLTIAEFKTITDFLR